MLHRPSLYLCVALSILNCGCPTPTTSAPAPHTAADGVKPAGKTVVIQSAVVEHGPPAWKVEVNRLDGRPSLSSVNFLDERSGWAVGGGGLFKTSDGGRVWSRVVVEAAPPSAVALAHFTTPDEGWVGLQKAAPDVSSYGENRLRLLHTADGGKGWQTVYEAEGVRAQRFYAAGQNVWLWGIRYRGSSPLRFDPVLLRTSDRGQNWSDISAGLNGVAAGGDDSVNGWVTAMSAEGGDTIFVTTSKGQLLKTVDGGQGWERLGFVDAEDEWPYFFRLDVKNNGHFRVAGGADNIHGVWGLVAEQKDDNPWVVRKLSDVHFADVVYIFDEQMLACGSISSGKGPADGSGRRQGAVLHSPDGGQTWSVVYRDTNVKSVNSLAAVNAEQIWAAGEDGLILKLRPSSKGVPLARR